MENEAKPLMTLKEKSRQFTHQLKRKKRFEYLMRNRKQFLEKKTSMKNKEHLNDISIFENNEFELESETDSIKVKFESKNKKTILVLNSKGKKNKY